MEKKITCELQQKGCGGCSMLSLPYDEQLKKKQKTVNKLLGKFGKVSPIIGMEEPFHYRNKVISTFYAGKDKKIKSGIYIQGTHKVLSVTKCYLHKEELDDAVEAVRQAARFCKYQPYNEDKDTGLIRHVLVRHSRLTGEILVCLVTASQILPGSKNFVKKLRELNPKITTIVQNINSRATSAVLGEKEKILYGKGFIVDELCGVRFRIAASSFYQINPIQTEKLYNAAIQAAGLNGKQSVLDAYCGVGTIGLSAAKKAKSVIGVESNKSAVQCAVQNVRDNGVKNAKFICEDATIFIQKMAAGEQRVDVVFMDPPRAGSTPEFLDAVSCMNPQKIVYVSCNPETQKRDLERLVKKGWKVEMIQPFDLFPHTEHVESVCLLSKLQNRQHIKMELVMDELDLTDADK